MGCAMPNGVLINQPRVARYELPWKVERRCANPNGIVSVTGALSRDATPLGLAPFF